jgi:uncharacterized protein YidB (DUF937 family)
MGILNTVESMAARHSIEENTRVATALMEELEQREGVGGLMQDFQRNGMGSFVEEWAHGKTQPNASAVGDGLAGTGLIDSIALRTGLTHGVVRGALAEVIPCMIHYMTANNYVSVTGKPLGKQPDMGDVVESVMKRVSR